MVEFPGASASAAEATQAEDIRDQLLSLAARGKIKSTERFLRKANLKQLERIKGEYDRQQTEVVDELVSKYFIWALSTLMRNLEYIGEDECEEMKKTLLDNDLVKRDLGDLSGYITANIKYVGIATMVAVAGGYIIAKRYGQQTEPQAEPRAEPGAEEHSGVPTDEERQSGR